MLFPSVKKMSGTLGGGNALHTLSRSIQTFLELFLPEDRIDKYMDGRMDGLIDGFIRFAMPGGHSGY